MYGVRIWLDLPGYTLTQTHTHTHTQCAECMLCMCVLTMFKMADKVGGKSKVRSSTRKGTACSASKNATTKQVFHCRICQDVINEPNESDGDDSVHCNGLCDGWIHRRCARLSLARFEEISKSDDPFFCPSCCAVRNQTEIDLLKSALASLTSEVSTLKAAFDQIMLQRVNSPNPIKDKPTTPEQLRGTLPSPNATSPKPSASTKSDIDNPDKNSTSLSTESAKVQMVHKGVSVLLAIFKQ